MYMQGIHMVDKVHKQEPWNVNDAGNVLFHTSTVSSSDVVDVTVIYLCGNGCVAIYSEVLFCALCQSLCQAV